MKISQEEKFRLKLNFFLRDHVVEKLRGGKDVTIVMRGPVFDTLRVGPTFAVNPADVIRAMGKHSRTILFYIYGIHTYPRIITLDSNEITYYADEPAEDVLPMFDWVPLAEID